MDWFERRPENLAAQSCAAEAIVQLRSGKKLDSAAQQILDYVLVDWVMVAVSRPGDVESVVELHELCQMGQNLLDDSAGAAGMRERWQALADVLEAKQLLIRWAQSDAPVQLVHEPRILERLQQGETSQAELTAMLKLSAGRVSQVLSALEARQKVSRLRRGKESWVSLGAAAMPAPRAQVETRPAPRPARASSMFCIDSMNKEAA